MREKLLDAAQGLVQDRGFNGVSFQDLADAVGLKKPSVFHHFRNKDELARSLMERCRTTYGARYGEILEREEMSEPEKLREIARVFEEGLRQDRLCLLGALSTTRNEYSDELKNELQETAGQVIERYEQVFERGRNSGSLTYSGSANEAATAFLAMLQGLQVLARAQCDANSFLPTAFAYIDSLAVK